MCFQCWMLFRLDVIARDFRRIGAPRRRRSVSTWANSVDVFVAKKIVYAAIFVYKALFSSFEFRFLLGGPLFTET